MVFVEVHIWAGAARPPGDGCHREALETAIAEGARRKHAGLYRQRRIVGQHLERFRRLDIAEDRRAVQSLDRRRRAIGLRAGGDVDAEILGLA